jgi:hypothetical protein
MKKARLSLSGLYCFLSGDERITPWHLSICLALFMLWQEQGCGSWISASRRKLMNLSRIRSIVTYHKCIRELHCFGYLSYQPSYDPLKGSIFSFRLDRKDAQVNS